jgi:hypothetical protein
VASDGTIGVIFNEDMDRTLFGTVRLNGTVLTGTGSFTNARAYTIPYSGLSSNTTYNVTISGFKDLAGNVMVQATRTLTTRASSDARLLSVADQAITTTGGLGTTASAFTAAISIPNTKSVISNDDLTAAAGATAERMNYNFTSPLSPGGYSYFYNNGEAPNLNIRVRAEDGITYRYYRVAVTRAPADSTVPRVVSVSPSGSGAPRSGNITVTFSEPMDPHNLGRMPIESIGKGLDQDDFQWSGDKKILTVPYSGLPYGQYMLLCIYGFYDATGNEMADYDYSHSFTVAAGGGSDADAPVVSSDYFRVDETGSNSASMQFLSSEAGRYYYLVYDERLSAPDKNTVKEQGLAYAKGTGTAVAGPNNTISINGLTADSAYYVWLIVEDAAGNLSEVAGAWLYTMGGPNFDASLASVAGVNISPAGSYYIDHLGAVIPKPANIILTESRKVLTQNITVPNGKASITKGDLAFKYASEYLWWGIYDVRDSEYFYFNSDEYMGNHCSFDDFIDIPLAVGVPVHLYIRTAYGEGIYGPLYDITVTRAHPAASLPSVSQSVVDSGASMTDTSVTLPSASAGQAWEYRVSADGGLTWSAWQDSAVFTGLAANKTYTFQIRTKADASHSASAPVTVAVKTSPAQSGAKPGDGDGGTKPGDGNGGAKPDGGGGGTNPGDGKQATNPPAGTGADGGKVVLPKTKITKVAVGKRLAKISFKKVAKANKVTMYQLQYRGKGLKKWKAKNFTVKYTGATTAKVTVKKLKKGKRYQFRVRAWKTVSAKNTTRRGARRSWARR